MKKTESKKHDVVPSKDLDDELVACTDGITVIDLVRFSKVYAVSLHLSGEVTIDFLTDDDDEAFYSGVLLPREPKTMVLPRIEESGIPVHSASFRLISLLDDSPEFIKIDESLDLYRVGVKETGRYIDPFFIDDTGGVMEFNRLLYIVRIFRCESMQPKDPDPVVRAYLRKDQIDFGCMDDISRKLRKEWKKQRDLGSISKRFLNEFFYYMNFAGVSFKCGDMSFFNRFQVQDLFERLADNGSAKEIAQ